MLSLSDCRASPTDGTRSVPPEADVSATFIRGSRTPYPVGYNELDGRPLPGTGRRHQVAPHVLRHTPYPPPRTERASRLISSLRSQLLRSVTSAESHGALPSDASPLVSRETGLSPRETAVMPPTPVRRRTLSLSDCRASPTDGTRSVPPKADVSATFFRGSRTPYPIGHDVFNGRPLPGTGTRHHVAPHVLRHTPYLPPGRERASRLISSLE